MGDFQPEAHVKGLAGCNLIALICNKNSAIFCSISLLLYMAQKYNIYINEKALIITLALPLDASNYQLIDVQDFDFEKFYKALPNNPQSLYYLISPEPKLVMKGIKSAIRIIEAAGGLVKSEEDKYLFIKRNGRW